MSLARLKALVVGAREARRDPTAAEKIVWQLLRGRSLRRFKFRRQVPCDRFVLDFYCQELHLALEIDGEVHDSEAQRERDAERTLRLNQLGIAVVRFRNEDIVALQSLTLRRIEEAAAAQQARTSASAPLPGGEG